MAYFDCQIVQGGGGIILTVNCSSEFAGAAITATDGVTTLSQTCPSSSPYEVQFHIPNDGTWTISGTVSGQTYSTQVIVPLSAALHIIPNGSTATPTNVIQTWLKCADIFDKNYTTISQVLADYTTLLALISSNNAVDYMARSTSWASAVTADSTAMSMIGANNYCANTLLGNSTWLNAIYNSTYFENVLNVKVPTMTSNTTPSGVASASTANSGNEAFRAFDGDDNTRWMTNDAGVNIGSYIQYKFSKQVKINKIHLLLLTYSGHRVSYTMKLKGSNDGNTYYDIATIGNNTENTISDWSETFSNETKYQYYRLISLTGDASARFGLFTLQFYGRENV